MALDQNEWAIHQFALEYVETNIQQSKQLLRQTIAKRESLDQSFTKMGLTKTQPEKNLKGTCFWVPASINHQKKDNHNRNIYGGVQAAGRINNFNSNQA